MVKKPNFVFNPGNPIPIGWRTLKGKEKAVKETDWIIYSGDNSMDYVRDYQGTMAESVYPTLFIRKIPVDRSETDLKLANWQ